ncbi:MAG: sensor histidine kinase [Fibrobacteres bacterium]|nr:sensor histidine kinase [Fibrobacterota bacterium]
MLILGFLVLGTLADLALGFMVLFKSYRKAQRLVLLTLSGLFVAHLWVAYIAVFTASAEEWLRFQRILLSLGSMISLLILELTRHFLRARDDQEATEWGLGRWRIPVFPAGIAVTAACVALTWWPGQVTAAGTIGSPGVLFQGAALLIPAARVLMAIYVLYLLEGAYRFAKDYQRRIARLCFIGLGSLAIFHVVYLSRVLLYRELPDHFAEASSVVYGILYPVVLAGFIRYRLGSELISIPRDTMYTSATVFLTGASFLGVALTIFVFRWLRMDFTYFENFLVGFTLCLLAVLVLGSGTMRRRISRFINHQFYSRKYDYQEQFFRLHKTSMSGADLDRAITELVENMKYSVTVDDAYFFILNWQDGNFYLHENKEEATQRGLAVSGDSPLTRMLAREGRPVDLIASGEEGSALREEAREEPLVGRLRLDGIFPIFIGERLAGILALQGGRGYPFDEEDLALIAVFTNSIGDVIFKNRVFKERIEQKQFESFHHVASFIIHDIKNQIATLSLLLRNAEKNLGNPSFQTSMLSSIKGCAVNLQSLIDRLSVGPKDRNPELSPHPLRPLLDEVVSNSGLTALPEIAFDLSGEDPVEVPMDRSALFFVIRNLVNNALEAMPAGGPPGRLALSYGPLGKSAPARLRDLYGGGERFFAGYGAFVLVEDSGVGMDREFVRNRLFQPFATTKEKGVGIGLYQCKTLMEKMRGRILCHSEPGKGTRFCLLLAAAAQPHGAAETADEDRPRAP